MREIKFRGKQVNNGEWLLGTLRIEEKQAFILTDDYSVIFDEPDYHYQGMGCGLEDRGIINRYEACEYGFREAIDKYGENFPEWITVDPATVGQFTGLRDSKRTAEYPEGQEIYEGDIVHCWGGEYCQGYWEFNKTMEITELIPDTFEISNYKNLEVIGNRWDNPELRRLTKCLVTFS